MSGLAIQSNNSVILSTTTKTQPKVADQVQEKNTPVLSKDKLETSNIKKSPVWEGVKLETKRGSLIGGAVGALGVGGVVWGGGKILEVFNAEKTAFGAFGPKGVIISAGVGLVAGLAIGAASGAFNGAVTGKIVEEAKKHADAKGVDAKNHVKQVVMGIGAIAGAAYSFKGSMQLTAPIANPALRATAVAGLLVLSAAGTGAAASYAAERIYNKSK